MAQTDQDQERTEQASPRRREEARKKGQVAKSHEVASAAILMACLVYFYFGSEGMLARMTSMLKRSLGGAGSKTLDADSVQGLLSGLMVESVLIVLPLFLVVVLAGLLANYLQVGFLLSAESIKPAFSKINPVKGFQRMFSLRAMAELVKNILKIAVVGTVVYITVKGEMEATFLLPDQSIRGIMEYVGEITFKIILRTSWILVVLAMFDYLYQRWEYEKGLRMTKQEVRDEYRQTEGEPLVKARIRRLQREMAKKRMMANVPKADVVITNPDHIAVALQYEAPRMSAPVVVAKGAGFVAEKIREIARKSGVPIVENKPLARVIYKTVDIDRAIPEKLYRAVAEVLAYVYGLTGRTRTG